MHRFAATLLLLTCPLLALAQPIVPKDDNEVIEVLPGTATGRSADRQLRRQLARTPGDAALAVTLARRHLARAHEEGDPRFAGQALALLTPFPDERAPDEVLLLRAEVQQFLHEFDAAVQSLTRLLARPSGAGQPQAWLTLATVHRVRGRYADSDAACARVQDAGAPLYAAACLAENSALRGNFDAARARLKQLLQDRQATPSVRAWLLVTLAETEQRAGQALAAEAAFRESLSLQPDAYARLTYADFLLDQGRPAEVLALLKNEARSDAVLLRLALAGKRAGAPEAARDAAEMRDRIALANQRPLATVFHGREQAMFALWIDADPQRALQLARGNAAYQREPLDLFVLARAARASADPAALQETRRLMDQIGLHDRRIDAVL